MGELKLYKEKIASKRDNYPINVTKVTKYIL